MNDLIQELARRSGATDEIGHRATNIFCFTEQELREFAKLIIDECQKAADKYITDCGEVASLPEYVFQEHFGVK